MCVTLAQPGGWAGGSNWYLLRGCVSTRQGWSAIADPTGGVGDSECHKLQHQTPGEAPGDCTRHLYAVGTDQDGAMHSPTLAHSIQTQWR